MKTYAEIQGKEPFDWNAFLDQKTITADEWLMAYALALGWPTCACGNQCAAIPRDHRGCPLDMRLVSLGVSFCDDIGNEDVEAAKRTLARIEKRSIYLLNKMKNV